MAKSWDDALRAAAWSGAIAGAATAAVAALMGKRESGSAIAPINATSHVVHGSSAGAVMSIDASHTGLGAAIHLGSAMFWAALYERAFGETADRGDAVGAFAGGAAVAGLAYLTDYHAVPKRLTPGWEQRISGGAVMLVFAALAAALPVRGLLAGAAARRSEGAPPKRVEQLRAD